MAFTLPALPYAHNALEPHIDELTMQIHHGKHHQAYVDNLNKAIAGTPNEGKSLEELVAKAGAISPAVRNNGGGHWNHSFFWESLTPKTGGAPAAKLADDIHTTFGSFDAKGSVDIICQFSGRSPPCFGGKAFPEEAVIPVTAAIVADCGADGAGLCDQFFQ